jgi:hypothetical protein
MTTGAIQDKYKEDRAASRAITFPSSIYLPWRGKLIQI